MLELQINIYKQNLISFFYLFISCYGEMCLSPDQEFIQQLYSHNSYGKKDNTLLLQLDMLYMLFSMFSVRNYTVIR